MSNLRILGVDPGSRYTGWGLIDQEGSRLKWIASGRIEAYRAGELPARLKMLFQGLSDVAQSHQPAEAALEQVFVSVNAQSTLTLGQARGAAMVALTMADLPVAEYSASQVKSAVVGQGKASKTQVMSMVQIILNLQGKKLTEDEADALAVAICHANSRQFMDRPELRGMR
ncbi:MAG: crossover junction endodeoxyribonuclease RuvC [bacterium]|nr:crossover junction endodeoxyribonuclease RuvC [bacterium]